MTEKNIEISNTDYKNIFIGIAEKLFDRQLLTDEEKIRLINIINRDESLCKAS